MIVWDSGYIRYVRFCYYLDLVLDGGAHELLREVDVVLLLEVLGVSVRDVVLVPDVLEVLDLVLQLQERVRRSDRLVRLQELVELARSRDRYIR